MLSHYQHFVPQTGGWVAEFVRCVNGDDILQDWAQALNKKHTDLDTKGVTVGEKDSEEGQFMYVVNAM